MSLVSHVMEWDTSSILAFDGSANLVCGGLKYVQNNSLRVALMFYQDILVFVNINNLLSLLYNVF